MIREAPTHMRPLKLLAKNQDVEGSHQTNSWEQVGWNTNQQSIDHILQDMMLKTVHSWNGIQIVVESMLNQK